MMRFYSVIVCVLTVFLTEGIQARRGDTVLSGEWDYIKLDKWKANMFYWFYETENKTASKPLILFVPGGPGLSGVMIDNFLQTGPQDKELNDRLWRWSKHANLLYVDAPAGSGFSYVEDGGRQTFTSNDIADQLDEFLRAFLQKHTELSSAPLYIYGHSFGGNVAPRLALKIIGKGDRNSEIVWPSRKSSVGKSSPEEAESVKSPSHESSSSSSSSSGEASKSKRGTVDAPNTLNLQGVILAAPLVSSFSSFTSYKDYLLTMGLVDDEQGEHIGRLQRSYLSKLRHSKGEAAAVMTQLFAYIGYGGLYINMDNILHWDFRNKKQFNQIQNKMAELILNSLKNIPTNKQHPTANSQTVSTNHWNDTVTSEATYYIGRLLRETDVQVSLISGQMDANLNIVGHQKWIKYLLKWDDKEEFKKAKYDVLLKGSVTLAFKKAYKNFRQYHVLEAGHWLAMDQPEVVFHIMEDFLGVQQSERLTKHFCFNDSTC